MSNDAQPRSPRLVWVFGGVAPIDNLGAFLQDEQLDSGAVLADAFPNLARLEEYSSKRGLTVQATSQLALAWTRAQSAAEAWAQCGPRVSKACKLPLQAAVPLHGNSEVFSSKYLEDTSMETTLDRAVAVAWRVGAEAGLLRELRSELRNMREVDKMLRLTFLGASGAVNTWRAAVRAVERLERWSVAHGLSRDEWTGIRLSIFLSDAGRGGHSVPTSVRCGLKLMSDSLMLAWPLEHPLVMAVCRMSSRSAQAQRSSAEAKKLPCLSVEQLQHLEFVGCSTNVLLAIRWAALMGCFLAHACLRFSDAQRSESIQLGKASLFGFCWRSKRQRAGFPFAALRAGFSKHPWADALHDMMSRFTLEHSIVLDYVMPHFGADLVRPVPRPAKYACVVGLLRRALRCPPLAVSEAASVQVTLHACRRLLPTLAGQMLMSIESRRVLGHWGPQSAEPQRYDTSRCVSELAYKAQVSTNVVAGWRPGADFEPPPSIVASTNTIATTHTVAKTDGVAQTATSDTSRDGQTAPQGWVANATPRTKGKPRCVRILTAPGLTKCGWKFGIVSRTPKTFFTDKPTGSEFADCGACVAPASFRSLLSDAGDMPAKALVPGARRRLRRTVKPTPKHCEQVPSDSSSWASSSSSSGESSDGTDLDA